MARDAHRHLGEAQQRLGMSRLGCCSDIPLQEEGRRDPRGLGDSASSCCLHDYTHSCGFSDDRLRTYIQEMHTPGIRRN